MKQLIFLGAAIFISIVNFAQDISSQLDEYLSKLQKKHAFNGTALVAYRGQILLHKGYGFKHAVHKTFNDTSSIYRIGSLTKPFTAMVILRLAEEKKLSLQDPLSKYLPGYPNGDKIRIEHLLTHSSGVKEYLGIKAIQALPDSAPPVAIDTLVGYFKQEPLSIEPGAKFTYSNSNYILLAAVIQKVTGNCFEQVARQLIFEPLQMTHSGFDYKHLRTNDKATGTLNMKTTEVLVEDFDSSWAPGCGAMYSTARDIYRWYRGLYTGEVIKDSTREQAFLRRKGDYGYGWFNEHKQGRMCISHAGGVPGFLANLQFYPDEDLCIILLSNATERDIFIDSDQLAKMVFKVKNRQISL